MLDKVEILCSGKLIYDNYDLSYLNTICLNFGLHGLNIHGAYLDYLKYIDVKTQYFVNIDFPYSQNTTKARIALADFYLQTAPYISGFNFTLPIITCLNKEWADLEQELKLFKKYCKNNQKLCRFFFDGGNNFVWDNYEDLFDILENVDVDMVIFGSGNSNNPLDNVMSTFNPFIKKCSYKYGIFGTSIKDIETIKKLINQGFSTIITPPRNIIKIIEK